MSVDKIINLTSIFKQIDNILGNMPELNNQFFTHNLQFALDLFVRSYQNTVNEKLKFEEKLKKSIFIIEQS